MSGTNYVEGRATKRAMLPIYINGVGAGIMWSSADQRQATGKAFLCPPPNLTMGPEDYMALIDTSIMGYTPLQLSETQVEYELLMAMKSKFPCKK